MIKLVISAILVLFLTTDSTAQDLKVPTVVFASAAIADWTSTYRNLATGGVEYNPMLRFTHSKPVPTVLAAAAYDVAGVWAWNRFVGKKHPKIARAGLYTMAAFRIGLAVRNTQRLNKARR